MPRKRTQPGTEGEVAPQLSLDFDSVISAAEVFSKEDVAAEGGSEQDQNGYSPVSQTSAYMRQAVQFEEAWETTIQKARDALCSFDPRQLFLDFFLDLKKQIEAGDPRTPRLADLLEQVAIRGFGMGRHHIAITRPSKGATRWKVSLDRQLVEDHLQQHLIGDCFINVMRLDTSVWQGRPPLVGASDVSQHRSAVPIPARFFKRSVPFVLNNAAGALFRIQEDKPRYENLFNPKPDEALLRWMLIDPSYQDELEPEDYHRCLGSAMDVGQYKFDLDYLLKSDVRVPDVIFRDGSLFPQDAYLDNYTIQNKRGDFTREAIREMLDCLVYAREVGALYCGVTKNVQLKVYSSVVDWFIGKNLDQNWQVGNYTLNDGQAMSLLLASPRFVGDSLKEVAATCLIRRSFTTRANLNTRVAIEHLPDYFRDYQSLHAEVDITPYKRLCEIAHLYMFFMGHSKSPQQQLPRYEFFYTPGLGDVETCAAKILAGLRVCGLMSDCDHSFMSDKPITYLIPSVTHQAHLLSKDVGRYIDRATGQWIMSRYRNLVQKLL